MHEPIDTIGLQVLRYPSVGDYVVWIYAIHWMYES